MEGMEVPMKEESIQAFIGFLVEPKLTKSGRFEAPSHAAHHQVAKQMRAVVLLYNYYLRKQFPQLEFLNALTFCKTAVVMCAQLIKYMGVLDGTGTDQSASEFVRRATVTEKMVKEACDTCEALNSSRAILDLKTLPISKVAVFVVDAAYQKCILLFGHITEGVWSLVEKDVDGIETSYGGALDYSKQNKEKGLRKRPIGSISDAGDMRVNGTNINEKNLLLLAFTAFKEQTGIDMVDLDPVATDVVHSLTKAKASCQLYMMRCRNDIPVKSDSDKEYKWVPVEEALTNVQDPLLENVQCSYETTPAVSYFHLLPYSASIRDWLSRKESADFDGNSETLERIKCQISLELSNQDSQAQSYRFSSNKQEPITPNVPCINAELRNMEAGFMKGHVDSGVAIASGSQPAGHSADPARRKSIHTSMPCQNLSSPLKGKPTSMEKVTMTAKDGGDAGKAARQSADKHPVSMQQANTENEHFPSPSRSGMRTRRDMEPGQETVNVRTTAEASSNGTKAGGQETCISPSCTAAAHGGRPWDNKSNDAHGLTFQHDIKHKMGTHEKVSNGKQEKWIRPDGDVLKTAIEVITEQRNDLFEDLKTSQLQHQSQSKDLLNKITECDAHVNMILGGGNEALTFAKELCQRTSSMNKVNKAIAPKMLVNVTKRRKLSEGILLLRSPLQEINDICVENRWSIPSYFVSLLSNTQAKACFHATVKIRGHDFELEEAGELQNGETEAKESAASVMLSRLYRMSASSRE